MDEIPYLVSSPVNRYLFSCECCFREKINGSFPGCFSVYVEKFQYNCFEGIGTSINDLIKKVEFITGKKVKRTDQPFLLKEAPSLFAKNPLPENPIKLDEGIRMIMENLKKTN